MKHFLTTTCIALLLVSCSSEPRSETHSDVKSKATVEATEVVAGIRKTLPLPEFPDLPASQNVLQADQTGDVYFPIKSPYDFSRILNG